jgi:hypothetical protein
MRTRIGHDDIAQEPFKLVTIATERLEKPIPVAIFTKENV